jgi:hypothetical protein
MKKLGYVLLYTFVFILVLSPAIAFAASGSASVSVNASVNQLTGVVTISGKISSGQAQQVTAKVLNSAGVIDFLGQTASGSEGTYSFTYTLDETTKGSYTVAVGGTAVSTPATTTFKFVPDRISSGMITYDPDNVAVTDGKASVTVIRDYIDKALENAASLTITIPKIEAVREVRVKLPGDILDIARLKALSGISIDTGLAVVAVTPDALKDKETEGAQWLELVVSLADKNDLPADVMKKTGDNPVYDFHFYADGIEISKFKGWNPVKISLDYTLKPGENPDKLVIYSIGDKNKLELVKNSKYDAAAGKITFSTDRFSKFFVKQADVNFRDIALSWARAQIEALASRGIIDGTEDGTFDPDGKLTRAQYIKLLVTAFDLADETAGTTFTDVKPGDWYYSSVASAQKLGIVQGQDDNLFGADNLITRQDMAVLMVRTAQAAGVEIAKSQDAKNFSDDASIAGYAAESVKMMQQAGIINGMDDNTFAPRETATKAQASKMIYMMLGPN